MDEIIIDGQIGMWEADPQEIVYQISNATKDLKVKLNSVGGSVIGGISIFNALKEYNKGTVTIEIGAVAASIASYIALAGDKVTAHSNSVYMIHLASLPINGNYIDLRKGANISEGLSSIIANAYVAKTNMKKDKVISLMESESFYYGSEMLDAGFVDDIITVESQTDKASAYSLTIESLKACNNAIIKNETLEMEAVAKLLPKEEVKQPKVVDLSAQQKRDRELFILEQGVNL